MRCTRVLTPIIVISGVASHFIHTTPWGATLPAVRARLFLEQPSIDLLPSNTV